MASTPRSAAIRARSHASSSPMAARASVRAVTKMCSRTSTAARSLASQSSRGTTFLPAMWPHFFGHTWSSRKTPAPPASSYNWIVRMVLSGFP